MNLYLIRHAKPDYEHDTITELGHQQAKALADYLADLKVDELYHSSMGRAGVTAGYLAEKWNIEAKSVDWARELYWGKGIGDVGEHKSPWSIKDMIIQNEHCYPEGESWRELSQLKGDMLIGEYDTHCQSLDKFLADHGYVRQGQLYKAVEPNEKTVVIVCHGGVISTFVSHLTNIPFFQYISHMGVDLTAVTKFHLRGEKDTMEPAQLIYLNHQAHLGIK